MGLLIELDYPAATPGCVRPARARQRRPRIATDVPDVPVVQPPVALSIWEEASTGLDVESPVPAAPDLMRLARARRRRPRIELDTPLVPWAVAVGVWEEASVWLEVELPRHWIIILDTRSNEIYAHNARFRQLIRGPGVTGRDWLWVFNRHWLAALIWRHRPDWAARLPADYKIGQALPSRLS